MHAHPTCLCGVEQLPELRFDLREPPRTTERSEFGDDTPGGAYD